MQVYVGPSQQSSVAGQMQTVQGHLAAAAFSNTCSDSVQRKLSVVTQSKINHTPSITDCLPLRWSLPRLLDGVSGIV